jgi:hypothetical protein
MRFHLPYDAYQHPERVRLKMLTGRVESYDLTGDHFDEGRQDATRIYIESKSVAGPGSQSAEFKRFLAQAYSATSTGFQDLGTDPKYRFMWATTSPWKGEGFRQVASPKSISSAVTEHVGGQILPPGHGVDDDLIRTVSERVWVWVISDHQEEMTIGSKMRGWIMQRLAEEGA